MMALGRPHGEIRLWAIERTGSFGAGLATALLAGGERVVEVDRPKRPAHRPVAKSDDIDAIRAARQALAGDGVAEPRCRDLARGLGSDPRIALSRLLLSRAVVTSTMGDSRYLHSWRRQAFRLLLKRTRSS